MRALTSWAQVAASSGERRREAVLLAAERAQGAEGVAAKQQLGRGANARAVTGRTGEGRSWAQKRGVSGGNGDGPRRGESGLGREGSGLGCLRVLGWVWV